MVPAQETHPARPAQVEFFQIPSFLLENGLEDLSRYGALEHADRYDEWQWGGVRRGRPPCGRRRGRRAVETFPVGDADWLAGMCMQAGAQWFGTEGGEWTVDFLDDASVRVAEFWEGLVREGVLDLAHPVWSTGWFQGLQQGRIGTWTVGSWGDAIIRGNDPDNPGRWEVAPCRSGTPGPGARASGAGRRRWCSPERRSRTRRCGSRTGSAPTSARWTP
jgi:multiple sugar transport system substrate-binding protein